MRVFCPNCGNHVLSLGDTQDGRDDLSIARVSRAIKRVVRQIVGPKFSLASEAWLRTKEHHVALETFRTYREFLKPLRAFFDNMGLDDISISQVREYQMERRQFVGAERINHEIGVLKQVLGKKLWAAIAEEYKRLPQQPSEVGRALSKKEHKRLFAVAQSEPKWRVAYLGAVLAVSTTMARRELLSLRLKDLDLGKRMVYINRGKTRYRLRDIPLNRAATAAAAELVKRAKELGSVLPHHYVFPYFDKQRRDYTPVRHAPSLRDPWRAMTRAAGLPGLRWHDLRHTSITNMLENGTPERVAMELSGHIESRTLGRYSHQRVEAKRKAVQKLERTHVEKAS